MAKDTNPSTVGNDTKKTSNQDVVINQQKQIDALMKQVDILTAAADRHKLQQLYQKDPGPSIIRVSVHEEKLVLKWKLTKDFVRVGRNGIEEEQMVEVTLEDGSMEEMTYRDFGVLMENIEVQVLKTSTDASGRKSYTFVYDGKEYEIEEPYINH